MSDKITRPEGMSDAEYIIYLTDQISDLKEEELRSKITKIEEEIRHDMTKVRIILWERPVTWNFMEAESFIIGLMLKIRELYGLTSSSKSLRSSDIFFVYQDFSNECARHFANMRARERINNLGE